MTSTTRSIRRAGVGAGLALALLLPAGVVAASPASAATATATTATVSATTIAQARATLLRSIAAADRAYRAAVAAANRHFYSNPVVVLARAQRTSIVGTSTDPAAILAANQAYLTSVSEALETRAGAIDDARTTRFAAVDAAWAAYDLVVHPANALARNAYRAAIRSANYELRTHVSAAHRAYRRAVAADHATMRASVNAAVAAYEASGKTADDLAAFTAAVAAARSAFAADPTVVAARAVRHTAVKSAWLTYAKSVRAARVAFHNATGRWPHATRIVLPRI